MSKNTAKIEIDLTYSDDEKIGVKMQCDDKVTACDFLRVIESLSGTIQKNLEDFFMEDNDAETREDLEKVLMSDFIGKKPSKDEE